ncbi:hypothetical protein HYZ99_05800 [Candidatus Peregrinibacteria bacterium]|nr:hypothetical protein [Candidatus Peregrinibacteria bacterium]
MYHVNWHSSKGVAGFLLRLSFGLALLFHGIALYMDFDAFSAMTQDGLGPLEPLGMIWAYILPGLMIVGGGLFTIGMYRYYATWATGLALSSIPAGMMLKPVLTNAPSGDMMGAAINAFIWIIIFFLVLKHGHGCACGCCGPDGSCTCGTDHSHKH